MAVTRKPAAAAPKPEQTTALANYDEELAKYAQEASDSERAPSGNFISVKAGMLQVNGATIEGNKMEVIILDSIYENAYYEGEYDPNNPSAPKCFAMGKDENTLAPAPDDVPYLESEACAACPQNAWGSDPKGGRGKACKNVRRLCVISYNGLTADKVKDAEKFYLRLPVMSVKNWSHYVKSLASTIRRPPFGVITEVGVVPDPKSQFRITFKPVANVPPEFVGVLMAKREEAMAEIGFPYPKFVPQEERPVQEKKPVKRKF